MKKAVIEMENGKVMTLELYPDKAPITVANFEKLANSGFYSGVIFHRVISGFMIQGGDPTGTGMGGPGWTIKGEFSSNGVKNDLKHKRGVISMARTSVPDSAGSQFFIMHKDASYLDGQYAAFGMLTDGFDVLDEIAGTKTDYSDRPLKDQVIKSITVTNE
ncbi:MAG: peptidylprolyl isomerase [Clostridiales bacterium]|nr:peptidylprolyl isomerase [Clostridiales bacterium]